jgi:uncharacterized membrane protein
MTKQTDTQLRPAAEPIERTASLVMSSGMVVSFVFYAIGLVLLFLHPEPVPNTPQQYYHSLSEFLLAIRSGGAGPFLYMGTATLILTPFILVLLSVLAFIKQREKRFVFIASAVLMVMIASVIVASVFKLKI